MSKTSEPTRSRSVTAATAAIVVVGSHCTPKWSGRKSEDYPIASILRTDCCQSPWGRVAIWTPNLNGCVIGLSLRLGLEVRGDSILERVATLGMLSEDQSSAVESATAIGFE